MNSAMVVGPVTWTNGRSGESLMIAPGMPGFSEYSSTLIRVMEIMLESLDDEELERLSIGIEKIKNDRSDLQAQ